MIHFSQNTIKNAQLVYRVKDQLRDILNGYEIDEADLLNFADEFTASLRPEPVIDLHFDPGMRRDYRNYDVDRAYAKHQQEIFRNETFYNDEEIVSASAIDNFLDRIEPTWLI